MPKRTYQPHKRQRKAEHGFMKRNATSNGKKATSTITVKKITVPVTGISLNKTSASTKIGGTVELIATVNPSNATNKTVIWASSNADVATVTGGVVKGIKVGTATITATTADGLKTASCTVKVNSKTVLIVGNSKTYRTPSSLSQTRPSKLFAVIANEGGYLSQAKSTIVSRENIENSYIASNNEVTIVTKDGSTLLYKAQNSPYKDYLSSKVFDAIILQEKTDTIANNYSSFYKGVEEIVKLQGGSNYNGTVYIRTSWPVDDSNFSTSLANMNSNAVKAANAIKSNYGVNAYVIYDGNAFSKAKENGIAVHRTAEGDSNHQNVNGAYLAALCMYVKLYNENARNVTNNIYISDTNTATKLKNIANSACK